MNMEPGKGKADSTRVRIKYAEPDAICLRISIGGSPGAGYYATLRPGPDGFNDYVRVLERVLDILRQDQ